MIIDLLLAVIIVLALIQGYQRGLIVGIFSFVAILIGLAAAIKLSTVVAGYIGSAVKVSDQWLPVISFAVVFLVVVLLVRLGAKAIEKIAETVMLGWVNRLGGMILYLAIYVTVFSVALFYAEKIRLVQSDTTRKSATYPIVHPLGPKAVNAFGRAVPLFENMFVKLENFFDTVSLKVAEK